ncbi:retention module-containing protein, partial [uncultured Neptuniibacter sp.]|uniref:retention module-containing protein n=1 Tax=uncultured Neptuniibacter sp. TaxID=502143 RepID=UPI0026191185
MSVVGTVSHLIGRAVAITADGTERVLSLGDQVFADEVVRLAPDAVIEIATENGEPVHLDGGQSWLASAETYSTLETLDPSEAATDVESIQAAILAGADPTEVGEATAAGGEPAGGQSGNEGSSTVNIQRTADEVDPTAGFNTQGYSDDIPDIPGEEVQALAPQLSINDIVIEEPNSDYFAATNVGDSSVVVTSLTLNEAGTFSFEWNFSEGDYLPYNDFAYVVVNGKVYLLADYINTDLSGGESGVQTFAIELDAGIHQIAIGVTDVGDSSVESPLLIQNVAFNGVEIDGLNFSNGEGDWSATGTAVLSEGALTLTASADVSEVEGVAGLNAGDLDTLASLNAQGWSVATFTVTLNTPSAADVTVDFATADGTAISGGTGIAENDYGTTSGTLVIPAGETSATIEVLVFGDNYQEGDEQFLVTLSNPVNAIIIDDQGEATILDNDAPVFTLSADDYYYEGEGEQLAPGSNSNEVFEGGSADYVITLSGADIPEGETVVLTLDIADGTAVYISDYDNTNGIGFNPETNQVTLEGPLYKGDVVAALNIEAVDDVYAEVSEDFSVTLVETTVGTVAGTVTTTIHDDGDTTTISVNQVDEEGTVVTDDVV